MPLSENEEFELLRLERERAMAGNASSAEGAAPDIGYLESAGRGAVQGGTLGFADEIYGAGAAGVDALKKMSVSDLVKDYISNRDKYRSEDAAARSQNPKSYIAGDLAGNVGSLFIPGLGIAKGAGLAKTALGAAKVGGISAFGGSNKGLSEDGIDALGAAKDTAQGVALGGALGAAGHLAAPYIAPVAKKLGKGVKRVAGFVGGVKPDAVDDYLARSVEINKAPSKDDTVQKIFDVVDAKKQNLFDAKERARDAIAESKNALSRAADQAQNKFNSARTARIENTAQSVDDAFRTLKNESIEGSAIARESLNDIPADKYISRNDLVGHVKSQMNALLPAGRASGPTPGAATNSYERLQKWKDWLSSLPEDLDANTSKTIMQKIDQETQNLYSAAPGAFAPEEQVALGNLRAGMDQHLKLTSPQYAKEMENVAATTALLHQGTDSLGTGKTLLSNLKNIDGDTALHNRELLDQVGKYTGQDFLGGLNPAEEAAALEAAQNAIAPYNFNKSVKSMPETQALNQASVDFAGVKGASNPDNFVNRIIRGKEQDVPTKLVDQATLNALEKDIPGIHTQMKNLNTANAFTGQRTNGARNAVMFGSLGTGIGTMVGQPVTGALIGANFGGVIDKFGPAITKKGLDASLWAQKTAQNPNVQKYVAEPIKAGYRNAPSFISSEVSRNKETNRSPDSSDILNKLQSHPAGARYVPVLQKAIDQGGDSFATTSFILAQTDPEYQKAMMDGSEVTE